MSDRMIKQFLEMVQIPSESGDESAFIDYLVKEYAGLGAEVKKDAYGNLFAKLPAKNCSGKKPVLLSCHADTVMPGKEIKPIVKDGVIRSGGDTILGADDKAGIAEMLEALRIAETRPPLEIAISRQEETGLQGVKNMDLLQIQAKKGFLLDNDTLDTIIIGGPTYFAIDVTIKGRSAHAGMEPEKGINAILAASKAISSLRLGRLDHETTANVGVIQGGLIRNGVPDKASFLAECRSLDDAKSQALAKEMETIIRQQVESVGASVDITIDNKCRAVSIPDNSWTVQVALKALEKAGVKARTSFMTGFTDASIYNNNGIETAIVGIGARDEHSTSEHIYTADMEKAVVMIVEILRLAANS